jgi:hypothetical protein
LQLFIEARPFYDSTSRTTNIGKESVAREGVTLLVPTALGGCVLGQPEVLQFLHDFTHGRWPGQNFSYFLFSSHYSCHTSSSTSIHSLLTWRRFPESKMPHVDLATLLTPLPLASDPRPRPVWGDLTRYACSEPSRKLRGAEYVDGW